MTNQDAYNIDSDELREAIEELLKAVPSRKKRSDIYRRETAERTASMAKATISCMRNDYIIRDI